MPMPANSGSATSPSMPPAVVVTPSLVARASPSDTGSIPTIAAISRTLERRMILIIRSVPILPEPMIAARTLPFAPVMRFSYSKATCSGLKPCT